MEQLTILNGEHVTTVDSPQAGRVSVADLLAATGWELKPEGLCQGDVCVPVRDRSDLVTGDGVSLESLASVLRRPVVMDAAAGVAAIGEQTNDVGSTLHDRRAPDFTLSDINGQEITMSKIGRKKKVLVVWSSW